MKDRMATGDTRVPSSTEDDVTMEDLGDGHPRSNRPPDGRESWADKVGAGRSLSGPRPETVLEDAFVEERMALEFPDGLDGEPVITIGDEVLRAMNDLWKQCLIVKVLGKSINMGTMDRKLRELWRSNGGMTVMDLPRQFFLIRFEREDEYISALTGGPWRMFGSYLMVQRWSPDFDATRDEIVTTPVWVRFLNLPVNFYHQAILFGIGKGVGKPVKVDLTTLHVERARFARICVEVNLSKPLKGTIMVNGERYFVTYEGLPNICSGCGIYGHLIHHCPRKRAEATKDMSESGPLSTVEGQEKPSDGFTEVRRQGKRRGAQTAASPGVAEDIGESQLRKDGEIRVQANLEGIGISNKFANLADATDLIDSRSQEDLEEEDKENKDISNKVNQGKSAVQVTNQFQFGEKGKGAKPGKTGFNTNRAAEPNLVRIGPKTKIPKKLRPTAGLVFGPAHNNVVRSESGKRLRTEQCAGGGSSVCKELESIQKISENQIVILGEQLAAPSSISTGGVGLESNPLQLA